MGMTGTTLVLLLFTILPGNSVLIPKQWIPTMQSLCVHAESRRFAVVTFDTHVPTGEHNKDPVSFLQPTVIVWSPVEQFSGLCFVCPICKLGELRSVGWTDGSHSDHLPRLIYGIQCNVLLLSRIYKCANNHFVLGHNPSITRTLHDSNLDCLIPFRLWHIHGFTQVCLDHIEQEVLNGVTLQQLETNLLSNRVRCYYNNKDKFQQLTKGTSTSNSFPEVEDSVVKWWLNSPTRHSLAACFLLSFSLKEEAYHNSMRSASTTADDAWLSCDHTFKSVSNIGLVRESDKRWVKQYSGLFFVLNEIGEVMTWKMTRSLAFDHIAESLHTLKQRLCELEKNVKEFYIDNCCAWRTKLQEVYGSQLMVYLDIFHAVQRISKCIPKRHPYHKQCMESLTLVFRDSTDRGNHRTKPTPSPSILRNNLESFKAKWENVNHNERMILPPIAINEIRCLLKHIDKGCLSGIKVGRGTSRNERLHRDLNKVFTGSRYGVELGHALLTSTLYTHNERVRAKVEKRNMRPVTSFGHTTKTYQEIQEFGLLSPDTSNDAIQGDKAMISTFEYDTIKEHISKLVERCEVHAAESELCDDHDEDGGLELPFCEATSILSQAIASYYILTNLQSHSKTSQFQGTDVFFATFLALVHRLPSSESTSQNDVETLNSVLQSWNFEKVVVPGDGNCLFYAVSLALIQRMKTDNCTQELLLSMGLPEDKLDDMYIIAKLLRRLVVREWQENTDNYQGYTLVDLCSEASNYLADGEFSGDIGDLMVLTLSNILAIPITIFTSVENMPVLCVTPAFNCDTSVPLYLTYVQAGAGHYDYAVPSVTSSTTTIVQTHRCTCGRKPTGSIVGVCVSSRCPCNRRQQPCTSACRCKNCDNQIGKRPSPSTSRRRQLHDAQRQPLCGQASTDFMRKRKEKMIKGGMTTMEVLVLKTIIVYFILNGFTVTANNALSAYEKVLGIANQSTTVDFTMYTLTKGKIQQFLKNICIFLELFRQMAVLG